MWSPCPIVSKTRFRYFATFVDDHSRMTWLYFTKSCSKLLSHFCNFNAEIRTQFGVCLKTLRSDNAEWMNRHLLETARALFLQMHVLKHSWVDAISTTCFRIKRMLLSVLQRQIPYHVFFPTKTVFPIEHKIFYCTCFIREVHPNLTKLDSKSLKCIFLGYSRVKKGHKCYCPSLNRFVSQDVTFFKDKFLTTLLPSKNQGRRRMIFFFILSRSVSSNVYP